MMKTRMAGALAVAASLTALCADAVELVRGKAEWTVANGHYKASFDPAKAGVLTRIEYGKTVVNVPGSALSVGYDGQPHTFYIFELQGRAQKCSGVTGG